MKPRTILVDTGPLVAFLNKRDQYHGWVTSQLASMQPPLLTCEAVLSEACFVLHRGNSSPANLLELIERKLLLVPFRVEDESQAVKSLIMKYRNSPMSLADACLVRMAELIANSMVFTLDSDFKIYRKHRRQVIPTIMPAGV